MQYKTTWKEKLFASKLNPWDHWYLSRDRVGHYAINFLFFNGDKRKICQNVWEIYQSVVNVCQSDKSSFKGIFTHFSIATIKIA